MKNLFASVFGGSRLQTTAYLSGGKSVVLESLVPVGRGPHPAVLLLHGSVGATESGARFRLIMQGLAALGYAALFPHYFDCTDDDDIGVGTARDAAIARSFLPWQEAVSDAVDTAAQMPSIDPTRIGLIGFSLGSFLALGAAGNGAPVRCVIEYCGGLPENLHGQFETMPPVLILHGEADTTVPVTRAHELSEALAAKLLPHEMHLYPGQGHIFSGTAEADSIQRCREFLARHLRI
jgi:carboxymethylenebutenolidase